MKERGIIFSAPMVRALLAGQKTMTRRIVKPQPNADADRAIRQVAGPTCFDAKPGTHFWRWSIPGAITAGFKCPYGQPGDRLWVRETWRVNTDGDSCWLEYAADHTLAEIPDEHREEWPHGRAVAYGDPVNGIRNRSPLHMPRWASRITLELVGVRVERLHDISDSDAEAEGIVGTDAEPVDVFMALWESIHGAGSWDANPWLWCLSFRRVTP